MISLSQTAHDKLPRLRRCWQATGAAAPDLDAQSPYPLSATVANAIDALTNRPFGERIRAAIAAIAASAASAVQVQTEEATGSGE